MADETRETFWYYQDAEYPDEGAVFPFQNRVEAEHHAKAAGYSGPLIFDQREATDDEQEMINYGRRLARFDLMRRRVAEAKASGDPLGIALDPELWAATGGVEEDRLSFLRERQAELKEGSG